MIKREKLSRKTYPTLKPSASGGTPNDIILNHWGNIIRYLEHWYNNSRLHSAIGYITPNEKYYQHTTTAAQAA